MTLDEIMAVMTSAPSQMVGPQLPPTVGMRRPQLGPAPTGTMSPIMSGINKAGDVTADILDVVLRSLMSVGNKMVGESPTVGPIDYSLPIGVPPTWPATQREIKERAGNLNEYEKLGVETVEEPGVLTPEVFRPHEAQAMSGGKIVPEGKAKAGGKSWQEKMAQVDAMLASRPASEELKRSYRSRAAVKLQKMGMDPTLSALWVDMGPGMGRKIFETQGELEKAFVVSGGKLDEEAKTRMQSQKEYEQSKNDMRQRIISNKELMDKFSSGMLWWKKPDIEKIQKFIDQMVPRPATDLPTRSSTGTIMVMPDGRRVSVPANQVETMKKPPYNARPI